MLYAVQGSSIRWIFSAEEDHHLFEQFDMIQASVEIEIKGNWEEGFIFRPIIAGEHRIFSRDGNPFRVQRLPNSEIRSIVTSFDFLKVNRISRQNLKEQAEIQCNRSRHTRELMVYPKQIIDKDHPASFYHAANAAAEIARTLQLEAAEAASKQQSTVTGSSKPPAQPVPNVEPAFKEDDVLNVAASLGFLPDEVDEDLLNELREEMKQGKHIVQSTNDDIQPEVSEPSIQVMEEPMAVESVVEPVVEESSSSSFEPLPTYETEDESIELARMIVLDLNPILQANPELTVQISDDGKSIKLVREVIKWRRIV